jgi:hypothetical protein
MALTRLQSDTLNGLIFIENDIPNTLTFSPSAVLTNEPSGTYPAITSLSMSERALEDGGFVIDKTLSATLRIYNQDGTLQFANGLLPQSQQRLTYNGEIYRILQVKVAQQGTHFRIIAINNSRGV